jgi:hypothetical protein
LTGNAVQSRREVTGYELAICVTAKEAERALEDAAPRGSERCFPQGQTPVRRSDNSHLPGDQIMNGMKTCRHIATVASLLSVPCILACSSAGPGDDESNPESQVPNAVLFEAKWSDTGLFQILNDESGHMGMAVTGVKGKDDPGAVGKFGGPSFVDAYRSLRPNESVPPLLKALEARRSSVVAPTDQSQVVKPDPIDTALPAEQPNSSEVVTICKNWVLMACSYHAAICCARGPNANFKDCIHNVCPSNSDVSFFDNTDMSTTGSHALSGVSGSGFAASPHTWGWHQWWMGYPCAFPHLWNPVAGNFGVTTHQRRPQPCLQGEISE